MKPTTPPCVISRAAFGVSTQNHRSGTLFAIKLGCRPSPLVAVERKTYRESLTGRCATALGAVVRRGVRRSRPSATADTAVAHTASEWEGEAPAEPACEAKTGSADHPRSPRRLLTRIDCGRPAGIRVQGFQPCGLLRGRKPAAALRLPPATPCWPFRPIDQTSVWMLPFLAGPGIRNRQSRAAPTGRGAPRCTWIATNAREARCEVPGARRQIAGA